MPLVSRILIKASLIYLLVGLLIGVLMLINKAVFISPVFWFLIPAHIEIMIFGWIIQFTMGVAYWILPRYLKDKGRGSAKLANLVPILLNAGIILVVISDLMAWNGAALTGRVFELSAVLIFMVLHWKRVVTYNK
ncbi:MAG TPA: cbb3-type cytochrome c oxidase subunit I [Gracilimonas sp.]|nr:cbb3-type cytochrome c oxidase subunit I [Gracilimonas sp.]